MLKVLDRWIVQLLKSVTIFSLIVLFFLLLGNVVFRFVPVVSFGWFDEIVEMAFAYLVFFGSAALWRENEHFRIDLLPRCLKGTKRGWVIGIVIEIVNTIFFMMLLYFGARLTMRANDQTPVFRMPKKLLYMCIPVSSFLMLVYSIRSLVEKLLDHPGKIQMHGESPQA